MVRNFFKPAVKGARPRLDFNAIEAHCPDLAARVRVVRSRVKDLRVKFHDDCNWALANFNRVSTLSICAAGAGLLIGFALSIGWPDLSAAAAVSVVVGGVVGLAGAGSKAFGWHKRYHAMFRARWAMASLELQIDDLVHHLAMETEAGASLSDEAKETLRAATQDWLSQIDKALTTFGDTYGAAIQPVEIKKT